MPIRERRCDACRSLYEVIIIGSEVKGSDRCPRCGGAEYADVFNTKFVAVGLGGDAGVGKFYPYRDRGLGAGPDGRGIEVRSKQHREWLMTHTPSGAVRPDKLIPLDTSAPSGLQGTWDDIADRHAAEAEAHEAEYTEMMKELTEGPNKEAYHKVAEHAEAQGVSVAE